jgi:hypothetical protein
VGALRDRGSGGGARRHAHEGPPRDDRRPSGMHLTAPVRLSPNRRSPAARVGPGPALPRAPA